MRVFTPRWSQKFTETPIDRTDETDKTLSVGSVGEIIAHPRGITAPNHDDAPCDCNAFGQHYDRGGSFDGWNAKLQRTRDARLSEWRVNCPRFVVVREAEPQGELAACLVCGGAWELHGCPPRERWRVVSDAEVVEAIAIHFVLAKAQAIASGEAS